MNEFINHPNMGVALLLAAGLLGGCKPAAVSLAAPTSEPTLEVTTTNTFRGPIIRYVSLPGTIKAYQEATLYAKVAGYLKTIAVDKGDRVKEGAALAEIEAPELIADRAKSKAEVEVASIDYKRVSESQSKAPDLVTAQTVDNARGRFEIAKANLERTETLLNYSKIVAPFAGIVTRRMVDPGAFIPAATSGSSAQNAAILSLSDFSRVRVQVAVPEVEAALVKVGQPVKVIVEGLPGRSFEGKVSRFSYVLDENTRTMLVEAEMPNPYLDLRPGMYATVKIGVEQKGDSLLLPVEAVGTEKAGAFAYTLADNKVKKTRVQTGFNDGVNVEILSGLTPGQRVVVLGKRQLADGQAIKPLEGK
jgi:membrane fusion protein, multidrug efflux system